MRLGLLDGDVVFGWLGSSLYLNSSSLVIH